MADNKMQIVITALDETQRAFANLQGALKQVQGDLRRVDVSAKSASASGGSLVSALGSLRGTIAGLGLATFVREVTSAGLAFERVTTVLRTTTGSDQNAARELQFIRTEANRLGLDAKQTAEDYAKFLTSIKGTSVEGEVGRRAFVGLSEAMAALKKSTDESGRVFAQIQQSFAKGKLELEDLKIIAEAGVPIFGMLADSMGKTKPEIMKMISDGKLLADEVWPKVADQLHATFGVEAVKSAESAQGAINKLKNEYDQVLEIGSKEFMPGFVKGLEAIRSAIYPVMAEITRLGMLVDKAGGTLTTFGFIASKAAELLVRFATIGQFGDSFKGMADKFSQWNKMYAGRYAAGDQRLEEMAMREAGIGINTGKTPAEIAEEKRRNAKIKAEEEAARKAADAAKNRAAATKAEKAQVALAELWGAEISATGSAASFRFGSLDRLSPAMGGPSLLGGQPEFYGTSRTPEDIRNDLAARESAISLQSARIAEQEAAGAITATEAMRLQVELLREKGTIMEEQLSTMPKSSSEEISAYNGQAEAIANLNTQLNEMQKTLRMRDGWEGLKQGLQDYADSATNLGAQIKDAMTGALSGLETTLTNFVQTGKMSFKDLANSIIEDLIRIAIRASITGPLAQAMGGMMGRMFTTQAMGGVWQGGVQKFATGGLVVRPTFFGTSSGMGVMGEAGPEAIMPLARTGSGHLGVRTAGGGQQQVNVAVNVINQTGQQVNAKTGGMQFDGKQFIISTILENVQNNGPLRGLMAGGGAY